MKQLDPYDVLGVPRDASDKEIREAGKKIAKKTHPDAGGNLDAFHETRRALAILTDPKKRAKFDSTGEADEPKPDTAGARAMGVITAVIAELTNKFMLEEFKPEFDPRKMDVIEVIEIGLTNQLAGYKKMAHHGALHLQFMNDMSKRFSKRKKRGASGNENFDFIARRFEDEIAEIKSKIVEVEEAIEARVVALELLRTYDFRFDRPDVSQFYGSMSVNSWPTGRAT